MSATDEWARRNRPVHDPDYHRMAEASAAVESGMAEHGTTGVLGRLFHYETAMDFAYRRAGEVIEGENLTEPEWAELFPILKGGWCEAFVFAAMVHDKHQRGTRSEPLIDSLALINVNHSLASMNNTERLEAFCTVASTRSLSYVSDIRTRQAREAVEGVKNLRAGLSGHWMDGFVMGLYYASLGGHREQTVGGTS